ncbi:MAG: 30S ribosomal protein S4 [Patescibacteria group bacterium]|nr:30S ribosomal protein S4 [Patescibacteria group bacterium]MCL5224403.1 30S ribosomal protein S4 [Patescibacteria group bacterium]
MFRAKEKRERALGVKLSIKGARSGSPKSASVRRPYPPGVHGKGFRRSGSEYKTQLQEKQKIRFSYGLNDRQMNNLFRKASGRQGNITDNVLQALESRLDNVVYRLGFAESRSIARQLVSHGHMTVNGRKVTVPSYSVKVSDRIGIRPESKDHPYLKGIDERTKNYVAPAWLGIDPEKHEGVMLAKPQDVDVTFDINAVVDYYSR